MAAYAGVAVPEHARIRLRTEVEADVAVSRPGRSLVVDDALPAIPWLGLGASVGVEGELP
jgi:hypothetical protein